MMVVKSSCTHCDVAIIGSGPGGGAAASALAGNGLKVLVLEREKLPRYKPCGGAIPGGTARILLKETAIWPESEVWSVLYLFRGAHPIQSMRRRQPIMMFNRQALDYELIQHALEKGTGNIQVRDGFPLRALEEGNSSVTLRAKNGELVVADFVIAADGAASIAARTLGVHHPTSMAVAIDIEVEVGADLFDRESRQAVFDFFCLPGGYGWVFPKSGYLSCGVLSWRGPIATRKMAEQFLISRFPAAEIKRCYYRAHPIPGYCGEQPIATPRVCLVGDAARLVDPVVGEGIRYAMLSGTLAARAILEYLDSVPSSEKLVSELEINSAGDLYQHAVRREVIPELEGLWRFGLTAFLEAPAFFYRHFVKNFYSNQESH